LARHGDLPVLEYNDVAAFDLDLLAVRLEACASCAPGSKAAVDVWNAMRSASRPGYEGVAVPDPTVSSL